MRNAIAISLAIILALTLKISSAHIRFGETLCDLPNYFCIKIKAGDSWESLYSNTQTRDIVKRVNRMNIALQAGMIIAAPKNADKLGIYDISPFPRYLKSLDERVIYIDQQQLAWGAYDNDGELLWWGPISSGLGNCQDSDEGCFTPSGSFRVIRKQGLDCISTAFPEYSDGDNGGAVMPYCMHFFRGYALHGSDIVPGYRASHGCVRLFIEDARWLNEEFVRLPGNRINGTRIIIGAPDE